MSSITESNSSAAYSTAEVRQQLATNAVRDQNEQERQVATRLEEASENEEARRESRKIPGLGEAVDITV
ncbi:hypothetical protein [Roseibium aggregatum]|uniref:Uncharacterized protein n=1 Tax=Roseibium aggregatum TaxID=187304 RepID=A0A939J6F7_9HYPH|nr:hypothetical protein [Roseibium aggregatum]MBN9673230.1 hypothetical protein [Roseibium aggregatum]